MLCINGSTELHQFFRRLSAESPVSRKYRFKMKFALILLLALVVISQQFYLRQPYPRTLWVSPYTPHHPIDNYQPLVFISHDDFNPTFIPNESSNHTDDDQSDFPDTQSRIRGFTNNRLSPSKNDKGRFLLGGFGNNGFANNGVTYNGYFGGDNRFFKTLTTITTTISTSLSTIFATSISTLVSLSTSTSISTSTSSTTSTSTVVVTNTATLTVASIVTCVPQFQVALGAIACVAGRRKRQASDSEQFVITPSETLKLTPTALPSLDSEQLTEPELTLTADNKQKNVNTLASSKEETHLDDQDNLRSKRFLNRYQFSTSTSTSVTTSTTTLTSVSTSTSIVTIPTTSITVSLSTLTSFTTTTANSYIFSNQTITQTVNLINPAPVAQCAAAACVACLPSGITICAAAG